MEEVANLAIVCQVALEECEDFDQPLTVTVECHLRSKVPLHEMTRLQRRTARSLAKRRAKRVTNIMEAHGIPKVNLVAGVGVSDTGLLVFDAARRAAMKAAMMPAVAPQPVSDDPRKVKRTRPGRSASPRSPGAGLGSEAGSTYCGTAAAVVRLWARRPRRAGEEDALAPVEAARDADAFIRPIAHQKRVRVQHGGPSAFEDADVGALDAALAAERIGG